VNIGVGRDLRRRAAVGAIACALGAAAVRAQSLEPRAYSPNPTGLNFAIASYSYQSGSVFVDPSVPITDVSAKINIGTLSYARTFSLFGRSASAGLLLPFAGGTVKGQVFEQAREADRTGFADMGIRLTTNILGGPALSPREFAARAPKTTLGMSFLVVAPTGQYFPDKLINIGNHRWAFRPELGFSQPAGHWFFEVYAGVWFFTTNEDYFGGHVRSQEPIGAFQAHVSYTFVPRLWLAADYTYYTGGRTTIDGVLNADLQKNSRVGLTLAIPVTRNQSVKFAWSRGASTSIGSDFSTYSVGYQFLWFDSRP
jgi:hypothetical protein